jgi:hypothetical protein
VTAYRAHFALNPDARGLPYAGERVLMVAGIVAAVEAPNLHAAAEEAYIAGQKLPGSPYPRWVRSLSVGDVVCLQSIDGVERHWLTVGAYGFDRLDEAPDYIEADRGILADAGLASLTDRPRR